MSLKKLRRTTMPINERDISDESGQGLAEYALILALVAVVCVGALGGLGGAIASSPGLTSLF